LPKERLQQGKTAEKQYSSGEINYQDTEKIGSADFAGRGYKQLLTQYTCSTGAGGTWPQMLVLIGSGGKLLASLDLKNVKPDRQHSDITSIRVTGRTADIAWDSYEGANFSHVKHTAQVSYGSDKLLLTNHHWELACPGSATLPEGIDKKACQRVDPGTETVGSSDDSMGAIALPSKNIGCDLNDETVSCSIHDYSYKDPAPAKKDQGARGCDGSYDCGGGFTLHSGKTDLLAQGGEMGWETRSDGGKSNLTILKPGQTRANSMQTIACKAGNESITCWNGETAHGFFISQQRYARW
jgi:hypothetical protein